ncbi:HAD family hydrolase [Sphingomonas aerophila]|uniref:HAD superfamily phosphoserine phosphatase-like hydrolase n=1 Tax=Sphingomonas aerophila TaxID=1344948 RepID=A0A7W9EVW2_9SPHN|nr:HAD-IB family phosphatase [Sphingomonas aerophila]MBB5716661.1 HAD superfamily phosphoserine phosphatase-like hydrolase [Sphingomonas aerophila]
MTDQPVRLAIYDLDRTITDWPTWTPFLLFAARRDAPWRLALLPLVGVAAGVRAAGLIDRNRLKIIMHRLLLGGRMTPDRAAATGDAFSAWFARDHVRAAALEQMRQDRAEGRRIVIATAAHHFYADAIAARLEVADLVATRALRDGAGRITPALDGPNCYAGAKQAMLASWLADQGVARADAHLRFYSDHISDEPTFAWVDEAVVINPDAKLRALAATRSWRCAEWR